MAEVRFSRAEAEHQGSLPPLCMQCGAPATTTVARKYSTDQTVPPPDPVIGGCLLFPLWLVIALIKLISWSSARTMTVQTPLCHKHAHGWFTWSTLSATAITDDHIVLAGVSDQFAEAWTHRRAADQPRHDGPIKVRCRSCQALNDETAKFCGQCGTAI